MENKCSDPNIKGSLYVGKNPKITVNISYEDTSGDRVITCLRNIKHEIYTGFGTSCHDILDNILKEIEKVKDIL